jgi:hypothetical protein
MAAGDKTEVARVLVLARSIAATPGVSNSIDLGYIEQIFSVIDSGIQ